jgi:predicted MFS family arabinose efflux permease
VAGSGSRIGILTPFRIRDFRLLWTGMFVSMVGDGFYYVATAWQVYSLSNRPSALAYVGLAWSLPQVLLVFVSGTLADRLDRRMLMIAGDLVRCAAIVTVGVLSISGVLTIPIMVGLVMVFGVGQALFQPSFQSIVPLIVPPEDLVRANSVDQFVRPFALLVVGPALGGILVGAVGAGWAFIADGGTFLFSAAMIMAMHHRKVDRSDEEPTSLWEDMRAGLAFVRRTRWLLIAFGTTVLSLFAVWGPWETLMPFIVRNDLGSGATGLGLVYAAGGIGAIAVAFTFGQTGRLPRRAMTILYLTWAVAMFATAGFGVVTKLWQGMIVSLIAEGSIAALVVIWYTILQRVVPPELLGRVSSLDWMITIAGVPLSFAAVGPIADAVGADTTIVWAGAVGGLVTIAAIFIPGARTPERDGSLAEPDDVLVPTP